MKDFPISQLRFVQVTHCYTDHDNGKVRRSPDRPEPQIMHESQVAEFIRAAIQLHHGIGNVHHLKEGPFRHPSKAFLNNLWEIKVGKLSVETDSYWWCNHNLNDGPDGARLNRIDYHREWAHPNLLREEDEAERYED